MNLFIKLPLLMMFLYLYFSQYAIKENDRNPIIPCFSAFLSCFCALTNHLKGEINHIPKRGN